MCLFPQLTQSGSLYSIFAPDGTDAASLWVYFLIADDISLPSGTTAEYFWNNVSGWFLFIPQAIPADSEAEFVQQARKKLPNLSSHGKPAHSVVWLADVKNFSHIRAIDLLTTSSHHTTYNEKTDLDWLPLRLRLCSGINVKFNTLNPLPALVFSTHAPEDIGRVELCLEEEIQRPDFYGEGWHITLPLAGEAAGSLHFCVGLDPRQLAEHLGCNIQYVTGDTQVKPLSFPFFTPGTVHTTKTVAFNIWLNPLLPTHPQATHFEIDNDKPGWDEHAQDFVAGYFFDNDGSPLRLRPIFPGAGFAFSVRPSATAESEFYLSPIGTYSIEAVSRDKPSAVNLMPGLFSGEFFCLDENRTLCFSNHCPAYALTYDSETLSHRFTTSWAYWPPRSDNSNVKYFSQSSVGGFYGGDNDIFVRQLNILVDDFSESPAFPLVPYGGLNVDPRYPNALLDIQHLETHVLGPVRYALLSRNSGGPVFSLPDTNRHSNGSRYAITPQGMQVEMADDGSWYSLTLAHEEEKAEIRFLPADSAPWFPKDLALALTQNQLFMVATRPGVDWSFIASARLSGFQCDMMLDGDPNRPLAQKTIMVFKLNTTASLAEMAASPSQWTQAALYNDDARAVSCQLLSYIAEAKQAEKTADNPFENFSRLVEDKSWTGILFFNARIDGNAMPGELQMLLGGIGSELRIHHLGIQQNMLACAARHSDSQSEKSALFGVIFYDQSTGSSPAAPLSSAVDYTLEKLIVTFSNSAIVQFNARVGLTINSLFGRAVNKHANDSRDKRAANNAFSINGVYQSDGTGGGHITFACDEDTVYDIAQPGDNFARVIESVTFNQATLTPVSRQANETNDRTQVNARFLLSGELTFKANPFPGCGNLDLFSYGNGKDGGLPIANLAVNISFTLTPDGMLDPQSRKIVPDYTLLNATPKNSAIRVNSLLYSIPLKFSRFLCATDTQKLNASVLSATSVNILQLMSSADSSGQPVNYATSAAHYALEFDMPLGSLGALGANVKLNAKAILGWGPSTTVPDNDAAALFIQLPQLSAGAGGFELEGILKTTFGDASLLKVDLQAKPTPQTVYGFLFNNIQLSAFGYRFPPGVLVDFVVFAGSATRGEIKPGYENNLAWFLSAQPGKEKSDSANRLSASVEKSYSKRKKEKHHG
ncbi:TPA: hypothetical protein ACIPUI_000239 [Citrobacter freundii]